MRWATDGLLHSATSLGRAIGPLAGAAIAASFGLRSVFVFTAGVYLLAAVATMRATRRANDMANLVMQSMGLLEQEH